jgi:hypothetical protein
VLKELGEWVGMMESAELNEIRSSLRSLDERLRKLEGQSLNPQGNSKNQGIKEFLQQKNVTSRPEKMLVLAYYLENFKG